MPSGVDVLRALGLAAAVARGRPFPGLRHCVLGAPPLEVDLPRPGTALRRPDLSAGLDAALERAPSVRRVAAAAAVERSEGGFVVEAGPAGRFEAATVVAADGAEGRALAWLRGEGRPRGRGSRFGLRARCAQTEGLDRVEVHLGGGCEVYLTPLPGDAVNVAVLFERPPDGVAGPDDLLRWALDRHPRAARRLGDLLTPPAGRSLVRRRPAALSGHGAFLAGDAGGLVDPIVGGGVTIALRTGVAAARGAAALLRGEDPRAVDRAHATAFRRECAGRHVLATALRQGDARPRLARVVVGVLRRMPRAARALARVADGSRPGGGGSPRP